MAPQLLIPFQAQQKVSFNPDSFVRRAVLFWTLRALILCQVPSALGSQAPYLILGSTEVHHLARFYSSNRSPTLELLVVWLGLPRRDIQGIAPTQAKLAFALRER